MITINIQSYIRKLKFIASRIRGLIKLEFSLILDKERKLGNFALTLKGYRTDLNKEEISRSYILDRKGEEMTFLDVGARDGALTYMLGIRGNLDFNDEYYSRNLKIFKSKYHYYGMDLHPDEDIRVISGDACSPDYLTQHRRFKGFFDVIYSNNVFEHFERPWVAADNLAQMLKPGGIIVTVAPFSSRYHESPGDYFRYTHKGIEALFKAAGHFEVLESGYDILGRRINWQGMGEANDIVPLDNFGAWRETWFTVSVIKKLD
jgi:SAM-dependent methyltransferase